MHEERPVRAEPLRKGAPEPPGSLTRFIGREAEIENLRELLVSCRLVTLTGSGGSGKTRLAQELWASAGENFSEVVWVELSPIQDPTLVREQVAQALGIPTRRGDTVLDAIAGRLADTRVLLIIDNCEHVVRAAAELAGELLGRCRQLVVLATSREALSVPGETAWLVPPLSLPDPGAPVTVDSVQSSDAVRLFLDRVSEVVPSFRLTTENTADVAAICRRLDGIPLALELAAARLRALGPAQLLRRLDNRFGVLTSRTRTGLPRQRTLRATIDWSYDLLSPDERRLLDDLAVFPATFDLDAVEDVCPDDTIAATDVLDLMSGLVEKSLVEVVAHGSYVRYRLLESVRQYAEERLRESGREEEVARRHVKCFSALVELAEPHFTKPTRREWLERLAEEADNLRQILWWTQHKDPGLHLRVTGALGWYWFGTEHWAEGRRWLEEARTLSQTAGGMRERARVLLGLGMLTALQGRSAQAQSCLTECIVIAEELGASRLSAYAKLYLGLSMAAEGRQEATPHLEAALAFFRKSDDLYGERLALLCLGAGAAASGDLDRAASLTTCGLAAAREFGQDREFAVSLRQLSVVELRRGDAEQAAALAGDALAALARDPQHYFIAMSLEALACALCDLDRPADAARLFGAGERVRESIGVLVAKIDLPVYEPRIAEARSRLGDEAFAVEWAAGRNLSTDAALALGQSLAGAARGVTPAVDPGAAVHEVHADTPRRDSLGGPPATAGLEVRALGLLEITLDGVAVEPEAWSHSRPRELLLYLLCHPDGRTRQEVGDALWPDSTPAQVKNSFHVTLHHLRKTLGRPDWVRFENDRYILDRGPGVRFDASEFEEEVRAALRTVSDNPSSGLDTLRRALDLYRGDFLSAETVRDWHLEYRDQLRRAYADATLVLGDALLASGDAEGALDAFQRVVLLDDIHEGAHRRLMAAYARTGQRLLAVRVFERLATLLRDELSATPEADTLDLHRRILAAEPV